jgi:predicted XRE-type DNA-binding protein
VVTNLFSLHGKAAKEFHASLKEKLGQHAPTYAIIKNWVAQVKNGDFSTSNAPRSRRHKKVTTAEIIEQIHELILEDRRISSKSIAEQLCISRKRVGSIIHEDLDKRKISAKCVPKCLNAYQKLQRCHSSSKFWNFWRDPNDFL